MAQPTLHSFLSRVRRRLLLIGGMAGVFWAWVAGGVLLLGAVWLDLLWELSPRARIVSAAVAVAAGHAILAVLLYRALRTSRQALAVRRLDQASAAGGAVVSGWELSQPLHSWSPQPALTSGLARMAVHQATRLAGQAHMSHAAPAKPVGKALTASLVFLVVVAMLAFAMPSLAKTQWRRFTNPYSDIPPFSRITFDVQPGDARVIYGEGLDILAAVQGESVDHVELVLERPGELLQIVPMFPDPDERWRAVLARVTDSAQYHVRVDRARSQRYTIDVVTTPRIESVRFRIQPPAYTRQAVYQGALPKGGVAGLQGTVVNVWAKSNRPLSRGQLTVTSDGAVKEIALHPEETGSEEVSGSFTIEADGKFALRVVDIAGEASLESFDSNIVQLHDQRPFVRIAEPRQMSLATPTAQLPVVIGAEDDYGLAQAQLFRSLNNTRPLPMELPLAAPPPARLEERIYLPLSDYGLLPGDEIKLFARVVDNDPGGAKGAESSVTTVRIISQAEFERMVRVQQGLQVLMSKYQQAERRLERVLSELEQLQKQLDTQATQAVSETTRQQLRQLAEQLRDEATAIQKSAEHPLPYDIDRNLTDQLSKVAEALDRAARSAEALANTDSLTNEELAQRLAEAMQQLQSARGQYRQEALEPIEHLARIFPLLQDQSRFVVLVRHQRDLAERLASLKDRSGDLEPELLSRMRELEEEQQQLRENLMDLLADIESHALQLPASPELEQLRDSALAFASAVRSSEAAAEMSAAETGLAEFSGSLGHHHAERAATILESFLKQCEGLAGDCRGCLKFQPGLSNCIGNTLDQLLAEMGFGMGSGVGMGAGQGAANGFSAQRGGLSNMALYGSLPALGPAGGAMEMNGGLGGAAMAGSAGTTGRSTAPNIYQPPAVGAASSAAEAGIPLRYRQRVGLYFQRIADEASGQEPME